VIVQLPVPEVRGEETVQVGVILVPAVSNADAVILVRAGDPTDGTV
jgi:hypothetical protein